MGPTPNLIGRRFARLHVLRRDENRGPHSAWLCRCECGNPTVVLATNLLRAKTVSCGCHRREQMPFSNRKHGMYRTVEHRAWRALIGRCENPNNHSFKHYGGRGIRVCDEWRKSFEPFFLHIGYRPSPYHSIDRINNNGNYEPGNVRWATKSQQLSNRRSRAEMKKAFAGALTQEVDHGA